MRALAGTRDVNLAFRLLESIGCGVGSALIGFVAAKDAGRDQGRKEWWGRVVSRSLYRQGSRCGGDS